MNEFPKVYCPLCDQKDGHAEGCGIEGLNKMIDEQFLYGNVRDNPAVSPASVEDIKAMAKECRVVLVTGDQPLPAGLLAALGGLEGVRVVTGLQMTKEREAVDGSLDFDHTMMLDLVREHDVTIVGHNRLRAAEFFGDIRPSWRTTPALPTNRSETGRHGPYDSFHRKKKKGRR